MKKKTDMEKEDDAPHVNGWPVIRKQLTALGRRQMALAGLLRISPAAITQFKQGSSLMSAEQLKQTADFLLMDDAGRTEFYSRIFQARFALPGRPAEKHFELHMAPSFPDPVPVCSPGALAEYEPAVEPLSRYLMRRRAAPSARRVRIYWDETVSPVPGLSGRGSFILECDAYAVPGDMVYLKCRDFPGRVCRLLSFTDRNGIFCLGGQESSRFAIAFPQIAWLRPVTEISPVEPVQDLLRQSES